MPVRFKHDHANKLYLCGCRRARPWADERTLRRTRVCPPHSSMLCLLWGKTPGGRKNKEHYGQRRTLRTTGSDPQLTTNFWQLYFVDWIFLIANYLLLWILPVVPIEEFFRRLACLVSVLIFVVLLIPSGSFLNSVAFG